MTRRLGLCAALVLTLASCGDTSSQSDPGSLRGRITVQAAGGEGELKALQQLVDAFEAANLGVAVEFIGLAEQGEHIGKLGTAFAGGNPPDVFLLNYRRFGRFAAQGVLDLPAGLKADDYYGAAIEAFSVDGQLLCLPQNASSTVVYYNPALFRRAGVAVPAAGWTMNDMRDRARALKAKAVKSIGFETSFRSVPPIVWALGGEVVDDTNHPTKITLDTMPGREALAYLKDLVNAGVTATDEAADPAEDRFARGELAMFLDSRRAVPAFRKSEKLDFDVAPLPRGTTSATLLASDAYCVAKKSDNIALARAFAQYAVGPVGGAVLAESGRTVPSLRALAQSPVFLAPGKKPASSQVWLDVLDSARRLPSVAQWNEAESTASDVLEQYFADKTTLDAAVTTIARDSTRLLAEEG